ncbi:MAG: OmpA family protein [Erythrobacter sp.]
MKTRGSWIALLALAAAPLAAEQTQSIAPQPITGAELCNVGPYVVFFDWDSSEINAKSSFILDNVVSAFGNCGSSYVTMVAHTDRSGSASYNIALAKRRNQSVLSYLTTAGFPPGRITMRSMGEKQLRFETRDGERALDNRRVVITFGPAQPN